MRVGLVRLFVRDLWRTLTSKRWWKVFWPGPLWIAMLWVATGLELSVLIALITVWGMGIIGQWGFGQLPPERGWLIIFCDRCQEGVLVPECGPDQVGPIVAHHKEFECPAR